MPQISGVGVGQTYTTLAAWVAAESGSDYGVGNPAIAEITGALPAGADITGVFVRGYIVRAKAGEEFNPETLTGASANGIIRLASTTVGVVCKVKDIRYTGSNTFNVADNFITNCEITASSGNAIDLAGRKCTASNLIFTGVPARCFESNGGNSNAIANNCLSLGVSGSFSFVRWIFTNCLHFGSGTGFAATGSGSDYNASDDTSSPGANSLDNRTTADLVDFAGGDYRTASASALSTAGLGGAFIGFALEASSGISIAVTESGPSFTESINTSLSVNITGDIVENGPAFTEAVNVTLTSLTLQANIAEAGPAFTESITATLTETLTISADITEQGPAFSELITVNLGVNITSAITELGPSFTESINISVTGDRLASIVESGPSFTESIIASIPIIITLNPKNIIRVKRKSNTVIIKRKSNIIRVK